MGERLIALLSGLSPRERWLLAGLFGLIVPLAVVFLWVLPLSATRLEAKAQLDEANSLRNWVAARSAENTALRASQPELESTNVVAIGISGIEESLKQAGLRDAVTRLAGRDKGAIELRFDAADFRGLTEWLSITEPSWGYKIESFRFERTDRAGLVAAEFLLAVSQ